MYASGRDTSELPSAASLLRLRQWSGQAGPEAEAGELNSCLPLCEPSPATTHGVYRQDAEVRNRAGTLPQAPPQGMWMLQAAFEPLCQMPVPSSLEVQQSP